MYADHMYILANGVKISIYIVLGHDILNVYCKLQHCAILQNAESS